MPRRKPAPLPSHFLRREIACAAARMMAEEGLDDYGLAKRKAARALGALEAEVLPTNDEIEQELRAYQALYQAEEQPARLRELRQAALDAMQLLAEFRPCLTGPVLDGTAGRYADIDLELFADCAKDVEIFLLAQGIPYRVIACRRQGPDAPETVLQMVRNDGVAINLAIYPLIAERSRRRNRHTGRPSPRARAEAVAALLAAEGPSPRCPLQEVRLEEG